MAKTNKKTKKILNENWSDILDRNSKGESTKDIALMYGVSTQALHARLKKGTTPIVSTVANPTLRILTLDIENAPMMSYHWSLWDQSIPQVMRKDDNRSYMMSVAAKFLHEDKVHYFETRTEDDSTITAAILKLVDEADIIVGHNAQKFDMKKINAYAILNGLAPPSPYRVVDTMLIAKRYFSFERNTLDYLSHALCAKTKSAHKKFNGFELWKECMQGNEEAWEEMKHYNIQDVLVTEELYTILRPWAKGHPNVVTTSGSEHHRCSSCGSKNLHEDGYSITNVSKFQRYKCTDCNSFSRGRKNLLGKVAKDKLLVSVANG